MTSRLSRPLKNIPSQNVLYTFFLSVYRMFSKIDHILCHEISHNKYKKKGNNCFLYHSMEQSYKLIAKEAIEHTETHED